MTNTRRRRRRTRTLRNHTTRFPTQQRIRRTTTRSHPNRGRMTGPVNNRTRTRSLNSITLTSPRPQMRTVPRNSTTSPYTRVRIRHMTSRPRQRSLPPNRILPSMNTTSRIRTNVNRGTRRHGHQNSSRNPSLRVLRYIRRFTPISTTNRRNRRRGRRRRGRHHRKLFRTLPAKQHILNNHKNILTFDTVRKHRPTPNP